VFNISLYRQKGARRLLPENGQHAPLSRRKNKMGTGPADVDGSPQMGRSRGGLFAINLEPHHSLFKEPLIAGKGCLFRGNFFAARFPPNAGQSTVVMRWTDPNSAKNRHDPPIEFWWVDFLFRRRFSATLVVKGDR
jgi:hypothetical protein